MQTILFFLYAPNVRILFSYTYQNGFRIVLNLAKGKLYPEQLKDVTDFALLTFPGKIEIDTNPDSLSYSLTLNTGDIRDVSIYIPAFDLLNDGFSCSTELILPQVITPFRMPRKQMPTFFELALKLL